MFSKTVSVLHVPFEQLQMMTPGRASSTIGIANSEYHACHATDSVLLWHIQPDTCTSSAFTNVMETSPLSTHSYQTQLRPPPIRLPLLEFLNQNRSVVIPSSLSSTSSSSSQSSSSSSSSSSSRPSSSLSPSSLLSCFHNTVIFKRDKSMLTNDRLANNEVNGLKVFPRWKTPFVITAAFRAFYYKPAKTPPPTSSSSSSSLADKIKHFHSITRVIEAGDQNEAKQQYQQQQQQLVKRMKTSAAAAASSIHNRVHVDSSSSSSSSSSLSSVVERERRGVILERCVGSLHDAIRTDRYFMDNMTLRSDIIIGSAFTWQVTHH
jgi:hypothetical protein